MESSILDLGCIKNIDVINRFVELRDKRVIDAGCGALAMSRQLADGGANVMAIDPDPIQAAKNREEKIDRIEFVETGADQLPAEDQSIDGVVFSYSLHHVPEKIYPQVFAEVLRVLKPDGFLYVIEPIDGALNQVMRLYHNEDRERAAAQRALEALAKPNFEQCDVVTYHSWTQYESWDDYADQFVRKSFNTLYTEADVRRDEVRETFERLGAPDYRFKAPKMVMCLQGKRDS